MAQVGTDRIIEFQFSEGYYRLFLEFFAGGNIVLTDRDLLIFASLRIVDEETEKVKVGLKYLLDCRQNFGGVPALTTDRVRIGLRVSVEKQVRDSVGPQKKSKKKAADALRRGLAQVLNEFPPFLLEHALQEAKFDTTTSIEAILENQILLDSLVSALEKAKSIVESITTPHVCKGYIIAKPAKYSSTTTIRGAQDNARLSQKSLMYEEFHPFLPLQAQINPESSVLEFDGFNKTVDEFFSSIESQKLESRLLEREDHAKKKLETAMLDHGRRVGGLQQVQELNVRKAQALEANSPRVQEAIAAINGLLAQGMDWMDIARLIEMEQTKQSIVAETIKLPLKLHENTVTLLLAEATLESESDYDGNETDGVLLDSSDEEDAIATQTTKITKPLDKRLDIDVDLALSPWSNARLYYDQKKSAALKERKTIQSSEKALQNTGKKIDADLRKGLKQEKEVLRPQRKTMWFEKFMYFISSEGYLVIGGKDAQQDG